jgi:hypothetical protein
MFVWMLGKKLHMLMGRKFIFILFELFWFIAHLKEFSCRETLNSLSSCLATKRLSLCSRDGLIPTLWSGSHLQAVREIKSENLKFFL